MPLQPKTPFTVSYSARLVGLRPAEVIAIADQIAETLGLPSDQFTLNMDFVGSVFSGPVSEARSIFAGDLDDTINTATLVFGGSAPTGPRSGTMAIITGTSVVTVVLNQADRDEFERLLAAVAGRLPPFLASEGDELVVVRRLRAECADMAAQAGAVAALRLQVETDRSAVRSDAAAAAEAAKLIAERATQIEAAAVAAGERLAAMSQLVEAVKVAHQDVEDKQVKVTAVANNAADFQRRIEDAEQKSRTTVEDVQLKTAAAISDLQTRAIASVSAIEAGSISTIGDLRLNSSQAVTEHTARTAAIVTKNEDLQKAVEVLLQGANAGELFKSFQSRKSELESTQNGWLWGLAAVTACVVLGGGFMVYELASSAGNELGLVAIKVTILLPLVVLDVFIANQYNHRRALIEEYAFKSAISLSLLPYKDLVVSQASDAASLKFVLDAVEKIYSNPTEAAMRPGTMTKEVRRAMKVLQESGIVDLAKSAAERAKP